MEVLLIVACSSAVDHSTVEVQSTGPEMEQESALALSVSVGLPVVEAAQRICSVVVGPQLKSRHSDRILDEI